VSAGIDPLTGKRRFLRATAPTEKLAEKALTNLLHQVDQQTHARSDLTVGEVIEKWLTIKEPVHVRKTRVRTRQLVRDYIEPRFGSMKAAKLDAEVLENYYALLQTCKHNAVRGTSHKDHECEPLANSSVRAIHFVLRPAFDRAVKWGYLGRNVVAFTEPPPFGAPDPDPPTPEELAPVINEAWRDPAWGLFLWLTMITGSRRGEICVLRWTDVDLSRSTLMVERAGDQYDGEVMEGPTKSRQKRRVRLDDYTVDLLRAYKGKCRRQVEEMGSELARNAFVFSLTPDFSKPLKPNTATQRYRRLAKRNGLRSTRLHSIRHYSATELLTAGIDLRSVAGRLGHGSGGATTLKFYAAWVEKADTAAAETLAQSIPRPDFGERKPRHAFEKLAAELRGAIESGQYPVGSELPYARELAAAHNVSVGTVSRAIADLKDRGLVEAKQYRRATVISQDTARRTTHLEEAG
jgi:integrase/DNA-binding transcriptional regulator YhcF (GntR family)